MKNITTNTKNMLEILSYPFFQNALIGGILIALTSSILGVFIVMRKEANIAHSISNFIFLGIAFSLLLSGNYYFYGFLFAIIGAILIYFIEQTNFISKESTKEIISQAGIGGGIFLIGFLGSLQLDIFNFLFGSILFINMTDITIISGLFIIGYILFFLFGKNFLALNISEDIAKTKGIPVGIYNLCFITFLALFIGISIKIFGIMLIGAFLVIPSNIGKLLANSTRGVFLYSLVISVLGVVLGLFISYGLGTSSGATIVVLLIILFIVSLLFKKLLK